jgi:hypothetical protein
MNREQIIAAMAEAILDHQWPQLCDRLRKMDGGEVFHALFPIAADAQGHGPAYDAACLLFAVEPACPIPCKEAIRALLSHWDISIEEVPWYLAGRFGEEAIRRAITELRAESLGRTERIALDTVWYWAEIYFTQTQGEIRELQRDRQVERARPATPGGTDELSTRLYRTGS